MSKQLSLAILAIALWAPGLAQAQSGCQKSYGFQVSISGNAGQPVCDSKSSAFVDALRNFTISNVAYTDTSIASVAGRFNDVTTNLAYLTSSATLNYNFVELGISGSFTGANRQESQRLLEDYVKKNGIIGQIMNYQAKHSATSPITGAGGMIPMTIAADFNDSMNAPTLMGGAAPGGNSDNLIGVGLSYGAYNVSNSSDKVTSTSIPLWYTIRNNIDPRRQLTFSLPLTLVQVGDAKTVHTGLGVAYRFPITDNWSLSPGIRYSGVASIDRATAASVYSAALTSTYVMPFSGFDIAIGNMLGYYRTGKLSAGSYSYNPDLKYLALRNGIMLSQPVNFGQKLSLEYSLIDTRYLGEKPYFDKFQEIGVTLGTNKNAQDARSFIRGGLNYMQGPGTRGVTLNIGYWF